MCYLRGKRLSVCCVFRVVIVRVLKSSNISCLTFQSGSVGVAEGWSSEYVRTFVCFEASGMNSGVAQKAGHRFGVSLEDLFTVITAGMGGGSRQSGTGWRRPRHGYEGIVIGLYGVVVNLTHVIEPVLKSMLDTPHCCSG